MARLETSGLGRSSLGGLFSFEGNLFLSRRLTLLNKYCRFIYGFCWELFQQKQPFIVLDGKECGTMFVLAIMVQLLLICLSSQLVSLAEKIDHLFNKGDKLNLGLAALVLILAVYIYFWAQFGAQMNSLGVNLALGLFQVGSLYVAVACLRKMREDDKSVL